MHDVLGEEGMWPSFATIPWGYLPGPHPAAQYAPDACMDLDQQSKCTTVGSTIEISSQIQSAGPEVLCAVPWSTLRAAIDVAEATEQIRGFCIHIYSQNPINFPCSTPSDH